MIHGSDSCTSVEAPSAVMGIHDEPVEDSFHDLQVIRAMRACITHGNDRDEHFEGSQLAVLRTLKLTDHGPIFFSIDMEHHMGRKDFPLELGISWYIHNRIHDEHIIIRENLRLKNYGKLPDNRHRFNFGSSIMLSKYAVKTHVNTLLDRLEKLSAGKQPLVLLGHAIEGDLKDLKALGVDLSHRNITVCDVQIAHRQYYVEPHVRKLTYILGSFGIAHHNLHNAANDSHYTLEYGLKMISELVEPSIIQ